MKKMVYGSWLFLVLLVVLSLLLAGCKPSVTGRLAGDVPPLRYQQLLACEQGGRSMTECRGASAITVEQYQAMIAQAGGAPPGAEGASVDGAQGGFVIASAAGTPCDSDGATQVSDGLSYTCINVQTAEDPLFNLIPTRDAFIGQRCENVDSPSQVVHDGGYSNCVSVGEHNEWRLGVNYQCSSNNQCKPNDGCEDGVCKGGIGSVCQIGLLCLSGTCEGGVCAAPPGGGNADAGKAAGEACANNVECSADLKCVSQVCQTQTCTETDPNNDPVLSGIATLDNSVTNDVLKKDECVEGQNQVRQFSCSPLSGVSASAVPCPQGTTCQLVDDVAVCQAGAPPGGEKADSGEACQHTINCQEGLRCVENICQTQSCSDTDEQDNPAVAGIVTLNNAISPDMDFKDECNAGGQIRQSLCTQFGTASYTPFVPCPQGTTCQLNADGVAVCQAGAPPAGAYGALCHADADCQFGCIINEQVCNKQNPVAGTFGGACVNGGCTNSAQFSCYQNVCINKANADRLNALPGGNLVRVDRWKSLLSDQPSLTNFPHQDTNIRMDFIPMGDLCGSVTNLIPVTRRDANYCSFNVNQDNYVRADGGDVKTLNNYIFFYVPNDQAVSNVRTIEIDAGKDPAEAKKTGFHILTNSLLVPPGQNGWQWRKYCEFTENQNEMTCTATINQNVNLIMLARARWGATSPSAYIKDIRLNK